MRINEMSKREIIIECVKAAVEGFVVTIIVCIVIKLARDGVIFVPN